MYMPRYAHHANLQHYHSYTPPHNKKEDKMFVHQRRHIHHTYKINVPETNEIPEPHESGNTKIPEIPNP